MLIDDLDRFNSYPWGRVAFRDAVRCLKKDLLGRYTYLTETQGRKEVDESFLIGGFVLPLQILAYEYYPSVAQKFAKRRDVVDGLTLPRMFQWVTNKWASNRAPSAVDVVAAFGDCALDELVSPYYTTGVFDDSATDEVITRYSSCGGRVRQSFVASTLWSLPQSSTHIYLQMFRAPLLHIHLRIMPSPVLLMSLDPAHVRVLESTLDSILPVAHHPWSVVSRDG
ncbi:uncharacterized protein [Primulina eburnea]|uniref:uncharacterized protein isoform X2 n=1 Tax=Primulina eburnea TaxID=1245227 RepID=UPI003C6C9A26